METLTFPDARRPDRQRWVADRGLRLRVHEWGDEDAAPLLLAHGGFDFAGTFDVFAPLLADAGWRVICWDQRGHGDSEHSVLYSWDADVRDALAVLDATTRRRVPFVGHSKGGSLMMQLADAHPHRCSHLVNIEGLPSRRNWPDVADHERTRLMADEVAGWLDRRAASRDRERRPDTIDGLAARRARMNPRLPIEWLRYLVGIGARHDEDGWRWKIDPALRPGGFGPWRPEWSMMRMPGLSMPVLGILGLIPEPMGWGTMREDVEPWLPPGGVLETLEDTGHFVHIEQPSRTAALVLDFLGDPPGRRRVRPIGPGTPAPAYERPERPPTVTLVHGKAELALHELRHGESRALLLLHGLAEESPAAVPPSVAAWPGPIWALDFTGHGSSTVPTGGGYTAEALMGDADAALAHLGDATVYGRGLGAYIALLLAGARPKEVRGAILGDGPGLLGGGAMPGSPATVAIDADAIAPPDPFALAELTRDMRPADYAGTFARLATHGSSLEHPLSITAVNRPEWLDAVLLEPGVIISSLADALARYAR